MHIFTLLLAIVFSQLTLAANPKVVLETTHGTIELELFQDKAPKTVANFLSYVDDKFYDGTIFHRVINNFMIQGGGFDRNMDQKPTKSAVVNEANNGLKNGPGTVAMARTQDPHSATAQFFINVSDNEFLNHTAPTPGGWGYAVFAKVINGMHVVDRIKLVKTGTIKGHGDVPMDTILIKSIRRK
jgi:peptidyl-prolyl cis-trans isomerase B (cyclophilin B)